MKITETPRVDSTLDCSGHFCPAPILMTEEKLADLKPRQVLKVIFTDPGAEPDLEVWCRAARQDYLGCVAGRDARTAFIRKRA